MKIFISWSGDMSRELGDELRNWIPKVIQQVNPYFSPNDTEKGVRWSPYVSTKLQESEFGIICLTHENTENPWIMFEAGALSKQIKSSYICPILFDIGSADLKGPLLQFQATLFSKNEIRKLVATINKVLGDKKLKDNVLDDVFEKWWPEIDAKVQSILKKFKAKSGVPEPLRDEREILEEILALSRLSAKKSSNRLEPTNLNIDHRAFDVLAKKYLDIFRQTSAEIPETRVAEQIRSTKGVIHHIYSTCAKELPDYEETVLELKELEDDHN